MVPAHGGSDDLVAALDEEHREIEDLFMALDERRPPEERYEVVERVVGAVTRHLAAEERYLHPAAREALGEEVVTAALAAQAEMGDLLGRVEAVDADTVDFELTLQAMASRMREHTRTQDADLFPLFRKAVDEARLRDLGDELRTVRQLALARPRPGSSRERSGRRSTVPMSGLVGRVRGAFDEAAESRYPVTRG